MTTRTPTEELTGAGAVLRKATNRDTLPRWLYAWIAFNTFQTQILILTDDADRALVAEHLPRLVAWLANGGVMVIVNIALAGVTGWALLQRRAHNERRDDGR